MAVQHRSDCRAANLQRFPRYAAEICLPSRRSSSSQYGSHGCPRGTHAQSLEHSRLSPFAYSSSQSSQLTELPLSTLRLSNSLLTFFPDLSPSVYSVSKDFFVLRSMTILFIHLPAGNGFNLLFSVGPILQYLLLK